MCYILEYSIGPLHLTLKGTESEENREEVAQLINMCT